jgi:ribosomal protein S12 methylthiotransferase accessory factor
MDVGVVGSGPGVGAVESALADVGADVASVETAEVGESGLTVVVGQTGDAVFERANERALATGARWLAVELGGVGGIPAVDAAVTGFSPETGCYECLNGRVSANLGAQAEPAADPAGHTARFAGAVAGREAARYVSERADIFGRVVVVPFDEREFLPLPNCACADGDTPSLSREWVDRDVDAALARAERAVDDLLGIVTDVGEAESFPLPYYLAHGCDTAGFSDASAAQDAAGVDPDWNRAFMKGLGEALERYCAGVYRTEAFETGSPGGVEGAVDPDAFVTEHDPGVDTLGWVGGENLSTGEDASIPAEFVHYPPPTSHYRSPVTTGLGLGNSGTEALLAGLYEVIERDAMMLSWYSSFEPLGLALDDDGFETIAARARSESLSVTPLLLTQDVDVPVVAVAVHREEWPRFALGTGAHLDVARAARSAASEALQNWIELRGMGEDGAADALGAIGRYADRPDTVSSLVGPETTIPAESAGPGDVATGTDQLEAVLDRVEAAGLTAYGVGTTTRGVDRLGFEAVRVVVPGAQPLCFGDIYFGERADSVPVELGFEPRLDRDHHPFP